ncbi:polysaccharide deacetylase family protein [Steroidobacter sp.]|uniref:polysaccharide deacetylase family protein n=1 Tax=Steroidobacter sp. TaxID=1978227 RepID=UPI001A5A30D4|nr:polysaccharide deacetylase family protein [Steroidobacter sp.]MBL8266889.1 polysaccharide deacetylase family protein [Steroidobacter sp.]
MARPLRRLDLPLNLCRADRFLLASAAVTAGSAAAFGPSALSLGIPLGAWALLLTDGVFRPDSSILYPTLVRGRTDRRQVALTFDDGPDPEVTPAVLDILAEHQARATFFVIGRYLEKHRAVAERLLREGHELGNHSWHHSHFQNFYSAAGHGVEIDRCGELIKSMTNSQLEPWYRPPVGLKSPAMARAAHKRNLNVAAWSIHSRDTFARDPHKVANGVVGRIRPGDIVLLHDGHERDQRHRPLILQALPLILKGLRERGFESVTVSEVSGETLPATPTPNAARLAADDARS